MAKKEALLFRNAVRWKQIRKGKTETLLPDILFETTFLMLNKKSGFDMKYQTGKVHNIKLGAKIIDKVVIVPSEVFSFRQFMRRVN